MNLDKNFSEMIAIKDGIKPEQVTSEYIGKQREEKIYPDTRYNIYSDRVCSDIGLISFTRNELNELEGLIDSFLVFV